MNVVDLSWGGQDHLSGGVTIPRMRPAGFQLWWAHGSSPEDPFIADSDQVWVLPESRESAFPARTPPWLLMTVLFVCFQSYDTEGRGHITYQEFLQKLGINYSADIHRPYAEDYFNFMGHFTKPQQMQEEVKQLEQSMDRAVPVK